MADESSEGSSDHSVSSPEPDNQKKSQAMDQPQTKSALPTTSILVDKAIQELTKAQGAMSLRALKKHVTTKYGPISDRQSRNITKYVKKAIDEGTLVQPKSKTGIAATFKVPPAAVLAAAKRRAAKAAKAAKAAAASADAAESGESEESEESDESEEPAEPAPAKTSKTSSAKPKSPSKKQASSKTESKASTATQKSKATKPTKAAIKKAPKSPMAKKTTKSPMSKPKVPKPKKVSAAAKSPKPVAKKTVAAKK